MNMDRFRFRAWDKKNNNLRYFTFHEGRSIDSHLQIALFATFLSEPESMIMMQCTGLKDSEGTLIWEGDVVDQSPYKTIGDIEVIHRYEVRFGEYEWGSWDNHICGYGFYLVNVADLRNGALNPYNEDLQEKEILFENQQIKVVGNIYMNLELTNEK